MKSTRLLASLLAAAALGAAAFAAEKEKAPPAKDSYPMKTCVVSGEALIASLEDASQVLSLRARNSYWGRYADGSIIPFAGGTAVNDYALDYLLWRPNYAGGRMWMRTTIPNVEDVIIKKSP